MARLAVREGGTALSFAPQSTNLVSIPYVFPTDAFTYTFWYKQKGRVQDNDTFWNMVGGFAGFKQSTNDFQIYAYLNAPNDFAGLRRLRFRSFSLLGTNPPSTSASQGFSSSWHQRAYVVYVSGGFAKIDEYEDGVKIGATHSVDYNGDSTTPSGNFVVGNSTGGSSTATNAIFDDVRIFNTQLTAAQVLSLYQTGLNPVAPGGWWPFDEQSGTVAIDSSGNGNNGTITGASYTPDVFMKARTVVPATGDPRLMRKVVGGNLIFNGDFGYAPTFTAVTTTDGRWVDGTAAGSTTNDSFGWAAHIGGSGAISFDPTIGPTGKPSIKLSVTGIGSFLSTGRGLSGSVASLVKYGIEVLPSTSYTFTYLMKTNYVSGSATNGAAGVLIEYSGSGSALSSRTGTSVNTTTGWTQYTVTFTTTATTRWLQSDSRIYGHQGTGTLIMDAWLSDLALTPTINTSRALATGRIAA
jgi:hypothetical protein